MITWCMDLFAALVFTKWAHRGVSFYSLKWAPSHFPFPCKEDLNSWKNYSVAGHQTVRCATELHRAARQLRSSNQWLDAFHFGGTPDCSVHLVDRWLCWRGQVAIGHLSHRIVRWILANIAEQRPRLGSSRTGLRTVWCTPNCPVDARPAKVLALLSQTSLTILDSFWEVP
jgi:hypothetical protein